MTTAIKRKNRDCGKQSRLQDAAIKSGLSIPHTTHCNNLKCNCNAPCKDCNCNKPRLNPLAIVALARYREELTHLEITRELSGLVDCCDVILEANKAVKP